MCWPSEGAGGRVREPLGAEPHGGADHPVVARRRVMQFLDRLERPGLLAREHPGDVLHLGGRHALGLERCEPVRRGLAPKDLLQRLGQLVTMPHPRGVVGESWVVQEVVGSEHLAATDPQVLGSGSRERRSSRRRCGNRRTERTSASVSRAGPGASPETNVLAASEPSAASANSNSEEDTCVPIPVRSRSTCAARSPNEQQNAAPTSRTGAPTLTGPELSLPVTLISPLSACRIRSNPPRAAAGPTSP